MRQRHRACYLVVTLLFAGRRWALAFDYVDTSLHISEKRRSLLLYLGTKTWGDFNIAGNLVCFLGLANKVFVDWKRAIRFIKQFESHP